MANEDWIKIDESVWYNRSKPLGNRKSTVFYGHFTDASKKVIEVAVKLTNKDSRSITEAQNLFDLKHPNVVRRYPCRECKQSPYNFYILLEYFEKNLNKLMEDDERLCSDRCQDIFKGIMMGLNWLHMKGIIHCDIHPGNILIDKEGNPVIADFDLSKRYDIDEQPTASSERSVGMFTAPEISGEQEVSVKVDMYSAGTILFWLVTGGKNATDFTTNKRKIYPAGEVKLGLIGPKSGHNFELVKDLIRLLLKPEAQQRPFSGEVLDHPFFFSDEEKTYFVQKFYSEVEHLPNKLTTKKKKRGKKRRESVKQHLNKHVLGVTGENWNEKLKLTDAEMVTCKFMKKVKRGTSQRKKKKPRDPKEEERLAKILDDKRCAIYNYALTETEDVLDECARKKGQGSGTPYDFESPYSLLRLIRNLTMHKNRNHKYIKAVLKCIGIWKFIHSRFPKFFLFVWNVVMRGPFSFCEVGEVKTIFKKYKWTGEKIEKPCDRKVLQVPADYGGMSTATHQVHEDDGTESLQFLSLDPYYEGLEDSEKRSHGVNAEQSCDSLGQIVHCEGSANVREPYASCGQNGPNERGANLPDKYGLFQSQQQRINSLQVTERAFSDKDLPRKYANADTKVEYRPQARKSANSVIEEEYCSQARDAAEGHSLYRRHCQGNQLSCRPEMPAMLQTGDIHGLVSLPHGHQQVKTGAVFGQLEVRDLKK